jgi:hypothetical protein
MHTFVTPDRSICIHHNGDFSGDAEIVRFAPDGSTQTIAVPCQALLEFVAEFIRNERVAQLENATYEEVFGLKTG